MLALTFVQKDDHRAKPELQPTLCAVLLSLPCYHLLSLPCEPPPCYYAASSYSQAQDCLSFPSTWIIISVSYSLAQAFLQVICANLQVSMGCSSIWYG
jgi:hypothetical protein